MHALATSPAPAHPGIGTYILGFIVLAAIVFVCWHFREQLGEWWTRHRQRRAVEKANTHRMVTKERKRTSNGLHLVLTICTFGIWGLLVWLPLAAWHAFGPRRKTVTTYR